MLVKDWMSKEVITVKVNDTLQQAINLMMDHQISTLPVVEDGKLVGIVTDRDVKRASPSSATLLDIQQALYHLSRLEVGAIMTAHAITVRPDLTIEEVAEIMLERRISGLPIVDDKGEIKGIITKSDLFKAMLSLSGLVKRGLMFGFLIENRPGSIRDLADVARKYKARILSILSSYDRAPEGYRYAYIRLFDIDRLALEDMKQELKEKAKMLYFIDRRENIREIYPE
jgi:acetoin utilization protein AcuB